MISISKYRIGFAFTGSFCTIPKVLPILEKLSRDYDLIPIISETVAKTDTRFMKADEIISRLESITGKKPISSIADAEPIGPKKMLDLLVICPCTGNTLSKLAHGITDTSVTMAYKAHRRNGKNVLIGISTNDALSGSAANIGALLNKKGVFFIPFAQDDPVSKENSAICLLDKIAPCIEAALQGRQVFPMI